MGLCPLSEFGQPPAAEGAVLEEPGSALEVPCWELDGFRNKRHLSEADPAALPSRTGAIVAAQN